MAPDTNTKTRSLDTVVHFSPIKDEKGGIYVGSSESTFKGRQITVSEGHKKDPKSGHYLSGGPFFTARRKWVVNTRDVTIQGKDNLGTKTLKYQGPICITVPGANANSKFNPSQDSSYLDPIGATAVSIINPENTNATLGVDLGEIIHDRKLPLPGIPLWKERTKVAKAAGSEYLNAQFGWLPLVHDMKNVAQSVRDGNTIMENYRNHSGTYTHREFSFDDIVHVSEREEPASHCRYSSITTGFSSFHREQTAPIRVKTEETIKRWFSGTFTYAAHPSSSQKIGHCLGIGSEADKLFGLSLSPDLVWELTPWSWAVDWFSNAGDVINNAQAFALGGLVMPYGYIMEETTIVELYEQDHTGLTGVHGPSPTTMCESTIKRRRPANPFGFGVGWQGLTPTQLAISAALGITRLL